MGWELGVNAVDIAGEENSDSRTYTPTAGEERDSGERTMGVGLTSKLLKDVDIGREKSGSRTYTPPGGRSNGTPAKGRWGGDNDLVASDLNVVREKI
jgi:hypothetical protein